jgi:hypothetical protein
VDFKISGFLDFWNSDFSISGFLDFWISTQLRYMWPAVSGKNEDEDEAGNQAGRQEAGRQV